MSSISNSDTKRDTQSSGSQNPFTELVIHFYSPFQTRASYRQQTLSACLLQACKLHLCAKTVERSTKPNGHTGVQTPKPNQTWTDVTVCLWFLITLVFRSGDFIPKWWVAPSPQRTLDTHKGEKERCSHPCRHWLNWSCFFQLACGVWCDDIWLSRNKENWSAKYFWEKEWIKRLYYTNWWVQSEMSVLVVLRTYTHCFHHIQDVYGVWPRM